MNKKAIVIDTNNSLYKDWNDKVERQGGRDRETIQSAADAANCPLIIQPGLVHLGVGRLE